MFKSQTKNSVKQNSLLEPHLKQFCNCTIFNAQTTGYTAKKKGPFELIPAPFRLGS